MTLRWMIKAALPDWLSLSFFLESESDESDERFSLGELSSHDDFLRLRDSLWISKKITLISSGSKKVINLEITWIVHDVFPFTAAATGDFATVSDFFQQFVFFFELLLFLRSHWMQQLFLQKILISNNVNWWGLGTTSIYTCCSNWPKKLVHKLCWFLLLPSWSLPSLDMLHCVSYNTNWLSTLTSFDVSSFSRMSIKRDLATDAGSSATPDCI